MENDSHNDNLAWGLIVGVIIGSLPKFMNKGKK